MPNCRGAWALGRALLPWRLSSALPALRDGLQASSREWQLSLPARSSVLVLHSLVVPRPKRPSLDLQRRVRGSEQRLRAGAALGRTLCWATPSAASASTEEVQGNTSHRLHLAGRSGSKDRQLEDRAAACPATLRNRVRSLLRSFLPEERDAASGSLLRERIEGRDRCMSMRCMTNSCFLWTRNQPARSRLSSITS